MPRLIRIEKAPASPAAQGLRSRALFSDGETAEFTPFVSLVERTLSEGAGLDERPPAGAEGMILVLAGSVEHRGAEGASQLRAGDAVWLPSGVRARLAKATEGEARLLEVWVGLPEGGERRESGGAWRLPVEQLAVAAMRSTRLRVVAGHFQGRPGLAPFSVPVTCLDVTMPEGGYLVHGVPAGRRVLVYLSDGAAELEGAVVLAGDLALVQCEGNPFRIGSAAGARFVLLHGPRS